MIARTHDAAAATFLLAVVLVHPTPPVTIATAIAAILANQFGGIVPDIDQPTAPFWRNLPIGGLFGKIIGRSLGGHRFLSHSILGLIIFGFLAKLLLELLQPIMPRVDIGLVWWAFMIGIVSHLVMDSFTKEGVPWFLPIPIKFGFPPIRRFRITTGKWVENFLVLPFIVAVAIWMFADHYLEISGLIDHLSR